MVNGNLIKIAIHWYILMRWEMVPKDNVACVLKKTIEGTSIHSVRERGHLFVCETNKGSFIIKTGPKLHLVYLQAEALGLQRIEENSPLRVPKVFGLEADDHNSFLILEYIPLLPHTSHSQALLGEGLAHLHQAPAPSQFGFDSDNLLGLTIQSNVWDSDWLSFFRKQRLYDQLRLINEKHQDEPLIKAVQLLCEKLPDYFPFEVKPSLLHGDLWSGNTGCDSQEKPVLFDPVCYYGHAEAELGIMALFGGFSQSFFEAYHALLPKTPGFQERQYLYQLYHALNHYTIFGKGYREACFRFIQLLEKGG
jgi:protein-ribulosamine 3-kinase